ncbi:MAG: thioredoxin [Nitrososphaerales archaeon]
MENQYATVQVTSSKRWQEDVIESELPVLVDFWAEWCGPCRMVSPVVEDLAKEYAGKVSFLKLNVDENEDTVARYEIFSIPTMLIFKDGNIIGKHIGVGSKDLLKGLIEKSIKNA